LDFSDSYETGMSRIMELLPHTAAKRWNINAWFKDHTPPR